MDRSKFPLRGDARKADDRCSQTAGVLSDRYETCAIDPAEDPDEKSQWAKMVKVREKMGKGPPVMLPYESKEKTDRLISSMSGTPYDPNTAISSHDWDKYEDPTKCAPNAY